MVVCENGKKRVLYVNCAAGIAGDMFLAALADASDGEGHLRVELAKLPIAGYTVSLFRDTRRGISGLRFAVETDDSHAHRHLGDIRKIVMQSGLGDKVKTETMRAFTLLAEAEAKVHGTDINSVHFHEVGAVDSIIDLTGSMILLDYMGWPDVLFSPLNVGSGTVRCEHGLLPVPAPAVAELLKGISIYSEGEPMERVTPTGAVLVKTLGAAVCHSIPSGRLNTIGTGLGARDSVLTNALRILVLETEGGIAYDHELCCEICTNIDDMTPEDISVAMERLFEAGALDVWFEPIQMKKNRPAVKLCCLGTPESRDALAETVLRETTSLGVRVSNMDRYVMQRRIDVFQTALGTVRVKSALLQGAVVKQMPEFDDVLRLAKEHDMPIMAVREILASQEFIPVMPETEKEEHEHHEHGRGHQEHAHSEHHHHGHHEHDHHEHDHHDH